MSKKIVREALPSEKAVLKEEIKRDNAQMAKTVASMLREDFGKTFQTDHGKRVLSWLAARCGWGRPPLAADTSGHINAEFTVHNAMELGLYLKIREFIPISVLQEVEYGFIKPSGTITEETK